MSEPIVSLPLIVLDTAPPHPAWNGWIAAGPLPDGWTRTFLLLADGFSKEMDINSASPDEVEPLPFHAMSAYPYRAPEGYPNTPEHSRYRATYNTRTATRSLPSIDSVLNK